MVFYPTLYTDAYGTEETKFSSDGSSLSVKIREHIFSGRSFESLTLPEENPIPVESFSFNEYSELTNCSFNMTIPVVIGETGSFEEARLNFDVILDGSTNLKGTNFCLTNGNSTFNAGPGEVTELWFEHWLIILQRQLPANKKMKACIFCAYSSYSVYGNDFFGTMLCFKNIKEQIVSVTSKDEYMDIMDLFCNLTQETFLCTEYKQIETNQWSYKDKT